MTKIIITAIIALASIGAHAQVTYKTSFDCAKASTYSEHAMCEDKALADADLAYWKVFQAARNAATDKQAFHNHAITAFKYRQQCADRECIVNWFKDQNAYIASLDPTAVQQSKPESQPVAEDLSTVAKKMDAAWQIYDVRERRCMVIPVFMYKTLGREVDIDTPEAFASAYGNGVSVKYRPDHQAAVVDNQDLPSDANQTFFFFAHGTDECNRLAEVMHKDGH